MEQAKLSEDKFITYVIIEDNIKLLIKYPKQSTIKSRLDLIEKFKHMLFRV